MSVIPAGWSRSRVFASGVGTSFTVYLERPVERVAFATAISIDSDADLVAVNGLNHGKASTIDASGNPYRFEYFANTTGLSLVDPVMFPTVESQRYGQTIHSLTVNWLTASGEAPVFSAGTVNSIELELWSYNAKA